jgi:MFS family permease
MLILVPKDDLQVGFSVKRSALTKVLTDRSLILLGLELIGLTGGASLVTAIMVYYMENTMGVAPAFAGLITGLALVAALPASPLSGRKYDRDKNAPKLLLLTGIGMATGLALAAVTTIYGAALSALIVGFCAGAGTTVGFSAARDVNKAGREYESLAVGWVNSIQLYSGFVSPVLFSTIVIRSGYATAWLSAGVAVLLLVLSLFAVQLSGSSGGPDLGRPQTVS